MSDYTPSTGDILDLLKTGGLSVDPNTDTEELRQMFDRWLYRQRAKAWESGRTSGIIAAQSFIPFEAGEFHSANPFAV